MKNKYFFLHIPKTAGTSLLSLFDRLLGEGSIWHTSSSEELDPAEAEKLKGYRLVGGHLVYSSMSLFEKERYRLVFLRNPVDRFLSQYYYFRRHNLCPLARNNNLEQYVEAVRDEKYSGNVNAHIWYLTARLGKTATMKDLLAMAGENLAGMDFVGLSEFFTDSVDLLCYDCGWPPFPDIPVENSAIGPKGEGDLDSRLIDRIREINSYDLELYRYGLKLFNEKKRSIMHECITRRIKVTD